MCTVVVAMGLYGKILPGGFDIASPAARGPKAPIVCSTPKMKFVFVSPIQNELVYLWQA